MTGPSARARAFTPTDGATYKLVYLARRRPDMSAEAFPQAWREHSALARTFATSLGKHFRSSRQCVRDRVDGADPLFSDDYDGSSILTMQSWPSLLAARYHPHALDELLADEKRVFAGAVDDWTMAVEEQELRAGDAQGHVLLSFLTPETSIGEAEFAGRSAGQARLLPEQFPAAARIVWNRVVDPARAYPFAAMTELWFEDRGALAAAARAANARTLQQTGIADRARSVHLVARLNVAPAVQGSGDAPTQPERP